MTASKRTVVPFERPAAYWRAHARRHDTPDKRPDAARMLRKALEKTGDPAIALELARIYVAMECTTAAERCLMRAVGRGGLTGEACYLIGCCALNRGEEGLAEQAFDACQRLSPGSESADLAQDALEMYPWYWEAPHRGWARSESRCAQARQALIMGRVEEAGRLARKAWKTGKSPQAALLMGAVSEPLAAIPYFAYAARHLQGQVRPRLLVAMACRSAGQEEEARRHLHLARVLCRNLGRAEDFCAACWEMGWPKEGLDLVLERLAQAPASVDDLRLKYLCLLRAGDTSGARRTLETLLDIDPDDAAGLWYRRHPEDGRLYEGRLTLLSTLGFQVNALPRRLRPGPQNRLLHWLVMALREDMDAPAVYRLAVPLWRRMPAAARRACDRQQGPLPLAVALTVLKQNGQLARAQELFRSSPGKKRLRRALKRMNLWIMQKE